jgi:hypothetical protein
MLSFILLELTWSEILDSIPTDPAAILAYLMIVGFVFLIWRGSRPAKQAVPPPEEKREE